MQLIDLILFATLALGSPPSESDPFRGSINCQEYYFTGLSDANWENCVEPWWLDDSKFLPYDVYYNGTTVLEYTPYNSSDCSPTLWPANMSFSIGGMTLPSDSNISRTNWDNNQYYMSLIDPFNVTDCTTTALCFPRLETNSSTSFYYWGQAWTLSAVKNGDGYDISGNLTTNKTGASTDLVIYFPPGCPEGSFGNRYEKSPLFFNDRVSMVGHITPQIANVMFSIANLSLRADGNGETIFLPGELNFNFSGQWWQDGAGLVTTGQYPSGNGVKANAPSQASHINRSRLAEIIGGSVGGILFLVIVVYICYRMRPRPKPPVFITPQDTSTPPPEYSWRYTSPKSNGVRK